MARIFCYLTALACASVLWGCPDHEALATAELTKGGFGQIQLTHAGGPGHAYRVVASRLGKPCTGTIAVTAMPASSRAQFVIDVKCKAPPLKSGLALLEETDPLADLRTACEGGKLSACTRLGVALIEGPPLQRDPKEAWKVHDKACQGGVLTSCAHLGKLTLRGLGGPLSEEKAKALFTRACEGHDMLGCAYRGHLHYINREFKEGRAYLVQACKGDNMKGCDGLGTMYKEGVGGKQNLPKARALYERACSRGEQGACTNLAVMLHRGTAGAKNPAKARELFSAACESGLVVACQRLKRLK